VGRETVMLSCEADVRNRVGERRVRRKSRSWETRNNREDPRAQQAEENNRRDSIISSN